jgi:serine/threonine protein kinase
MNNAMQSLIGETITAKSGNTFILTEIVGSGAQGVIYKEKSEKYMVKFYYPHNEPQLDKDIMDKLSFVKNVKKPKNFVEIRDLIDFPYTGYVMDRVIDHKPINSYLIYDRTKNFADWYHSGHGLRERLYIGYIIAKAFNALHEDNLSYCDISGNNILVKYSNNTISVRMIDIDNIYIAGRGTSAVLGTPRYIAPEVISRVRNPDVFSDNYSLAVILFELLRIGHPYVSEEVEDGTPEDEEAAFAGEKDYVSANEKNMLPEEAAFTEKLKELFRRCFITGKENRMERPSAKEFEFAMLDACNKVIKCPSCGYWHYPKKENNIFRCPWCDSVSKPAAFLSFYDKMFNVHSDINVAREDGKRKGITTYFIREGKNIIQSSYAFCAVNSIEAGWGNQNESFFTIVKKNSEYYAYNEFSKDAIYVKKFQSAEIKNIEYRKAEPLASGDEIFFDAPDNKKSVVKNGDKEYKIIRTAIFAGEKL